MKHSIALCVILATSLHAVAAEPAIDLRSDWPWWRGPNKNNVANGAAPTTWSDTKNILWQAVVPGRGHASPIVVGPRVFLATADEQQKTQAVLCYDRDSGKQLWKTEVHQGGFDGRWHGKNTRASATLACDGQAVYAVFYNNGAVWATALTLEGKQLWQQQVHGFTSHWGYSASPTLHKSTLIVAADNKGDGAIAALDRDTGTLRWRTARPAAPTYASPIVLNVAGKEQLLICGADAVHSYDPESGKELWSCKGTSTECVGTLVAAKDIVFASGGYPKKETLGVRADGSGKVVWRIQQGDFVPSLLLHEGYLYTVLDNGVACCWNADTGAEAWKTRLDGMFSASAVLAGEHLYVPNESGVTFVFKANPMKFELVAENRLGTATFGTPAICGGRIYLRVVNKNEERLYCIGAQLTPTIKIDTMQPWIQVYDPLNNPVLSPLLAAIPIVLLLGLLATGRVSAHMAAFIGLLSAVLTAIFAYAPEMPGLSRGEQLAAWTPTVLSAAGLGAAFGLLPIGWIVLSAIFLYTLTVEAGKFEVVKHSVATLSDDRRIQALLIAFSFGAFIEGAAGFGTPVAISAALMMGAGFRPLYAAGLALLANTSPVAFGALGTPISTLANVTGLDIFKLSAMAGRQLPFFSVLVPIWLVWVMAGWRGVLGVWPALLVCGGSFAAVQFAVANYHGPWLVDVAGGLVSLVCLALFLRVWQPREIWHFPEERQNRDQELVEAAATGKRYTARDIISAWIPWAWLTVLVFLWGLPDVKNELDSRTTPAPFEVPNLHKAIARDRPVVLVRKTEDATYRFNWLSATGTSIFLAAVLSAFWLRIGPLRFIRLFLETTYKVRWALLTIACMLAIAFTTRYSGMDATLGVAFTHAKFFYPVCAALLGWMGVALTGSDTSSNALFGSLQTITAERLAGPGNALHHLGVEQAKILLATANSTGGVMGKMIDAQSIVVAAVATQQTGQEGPILRFVFLHSVILALLMGGLVLLQAHAWSWMIP